MLGLSSGILAHQVQTKLQKIDIDGNISQMPIKSEDPDGNWNYFSDNQSDTGTLQSKTQPVPNVLNKHTALMCKKCGRSIKCGERSTDRPFLCINCRQYTGSGEQESKTVKSAGEPEATINVALPPKSTRPFQCPECLKAFKKKNHLVDHMQLHSGKKLFACHFCSRKFCTWRRLRYHLMMDHTKISKSKTH